MIKVSYKLSSNDVDSKPDQETRALLKANGFRWSPRNEAWQRQLTNAARHAARYIADKLTPPETFTPSGLELFDFAKIAI